MSENPRKIRIVWAGGETVEEKALTWWNEGSTLVVECEDQRKVIYEKGAAFSL